MSGSRLDRHEVLHLADPAVGEEARDEDVRVREVELLGGPVVGRSAGARRSRRGPCRGSRRTRSGSRTTGSSTSRSCRSCRRARPCGGRRRARARRSGGTCPRARRRGHRSGAAHGRSARAARARTPARRPSRRRARPRCGAVAGEPDRRADARRPAPCSGAATRSRGHEQQVAGERDAAADHDLLRDRSVLIALAMPMPSRSPRIRTTRCAVGVALARAVDRVVARDLAASGEPPAEERSSGARGPRSSASRSSARPAASALERARLREARRRRSARRSARSSPIIVWPSSAGARRAAVELAVEHEPAADAGADREHHEVLADDPRRLSNASASAAHEASFST